MRKISLVIPLIALMASCSNKRDNPRDIEDFNEGWKFSLEADSTAAAPDFKDGAWRTLNLPHDWSIEGEFSDQHPATAGGGALPGGYGVYRKYFNTPDLTGGKRVFLCFDGVYWQSTVYVNGKKAGFRPNGYVGFEYDVTDLLNKSGDNVVAVTVDNTNQPNSRWYSGSGIYRNVRLKVLNPSHFIEPEVFVTASDITAESAKVNVALLLSGAESCGVKVDIVAPGGEVVATAQDSIAAGVVKVFDGLNVSKPMLWSPQNPRVYQARLTATSNGKVIDEYSTTFGIRYFDFDPDKGFSLNGKQMKINGVCMHHDLGALGAAVNHRAIERQLEILREMGCNAIRTSHNPPAPELLNLCDSMGFIVMDEAFDMWARKKSPNDYAQYFAEWHERDLVDLVKRDRNHPSVIMWSIGNEILEQWPDINTDTLSIEKANLMFNFAAQLSNKDESTTSEMHVNSLLCKKLAELVRSIDSTRPVVTGNNETEPNNLLFKSNALDIIGFNYHEYNWGEVFKKKFPNMPLIITESTSALQTRGYYIAPADSQYLWPVRWDIPFENEHHKCSAYDNVRTPWGSTHEATLKEYMKYPWVSGIFVWTGFDYLGEPTPYGWPSRSSYFGIIDLAGFTKDSYYLYKSLWAEDAYVLHLLPHWNWAEGDTVDVVAYTNMKDVELFLNGESVGKKELNGDQLHLAWRVAYKPGELRAIGHSKDDIEVSYVVNTAGSPSRLAATADRYSIAADGNDLSFVTVDVVDSKGVVVPDANNLIKFTVEGPAEIVALDNGDQCCHEKFQGITQHTAFNGKCLCIVRS
ncbi:MAG: DUF4982 domain-containing protein, partial [Bacteroidales bacterium]|nr:DUF4982 domain-containing protein [Bacteroidales bacterium]